MATSLLQFSVSHDPSEIIPICWFGAQEPFLIIINDENVEFFDEQKVNSSSIYLLLMQHLYLNCHFWSVKCMNDDFFMDASEWVREHREIIELWDKKNFEWETVLVVIHYLKKAKTTAKDISWLTFMW